MKIQCKRLVPILGLGLFLSTPSIATASLGSTNKTQELNVQADESTSPVEQLSRGAFVLVHGEVTKIMDEDEFKLTDETGSVTVYTGWKNRVQLNVGDSVKVRGSIDDSLIQVPRLELYASELIFADGETQILR